MSAAQANITIEVFQMPEHAKVYVEIRNEAGKLFDPDTSILCTIMDPDGNQIIDGAGMTKIVKGCYKYLYDTSADASEGTYIAAVEAVHNSATSVLKLSFDVEDVGIT